MPGYEELLLEIARCPIARGIREDGCAGSPCHKVVGVQKDPFLPFHIPEPWSGHIETAPLLFLGSNPSIDYNESYPNSSWENRKVVGFFRDRFTADPPWINSKSQTLQVFGDRGRSVPFLRGVHQLAGEILTKPRPGIDYALTEIVHCKSRRQAGVASAVKQCASYLPDILGCAGANVLIVLGAIARDALCRLYKLDNPKKDPGARLSSIEIGNRVLLVAFLPHPGAFIGKGEKSLKHVINSTGLERLSAHLRAPKPELSEA